MWAVAVVVRRRLRGEQAFESSVVGTEHAANTVRCGCGVVRKLEWQTRNGQARGGRTDLIVSQTLLRFALPPYRPRPAPPVHSVRR